MSRWLPVLFTLLAQVAAMVSPMVLRHCESADGQSCLEMAGQECGCRHEACTEAEHQHAGCHWHDHDHEACLSESESDVVEHDNDHEHELSVAARTECDCKHSLLEVLQCNLQRGSDVLLSLCLLVGETDSRWAIPVVPFQSKARWTEMRSDPDAHLAVIATVALRV